MNATFDITGMDLEDSAVAVHSDGLSDMRIEIGPLGLVLRFEQMELLAAAVLEWVRPAAEDPTEES